MINKISFAYMLSQSCIGYKTDQKINITDISDIRVYEGDSLLNIKSYSALGKQASDACIELSEPMKLSGSYRIEIVGCGSKAVVPTAIFDTEEFAAMYHYDGDDLGAVINGENTTFKVWAPTASRVVLNLFTSGNGGEAYKNVDMRRCERGVWSYTEPCGHGTYYTYSVTTAVGTGEAVDPYAKAAGVNGRRGMVVDLARTDPEGWSSAVLTDPVKSYSEAVIWEVHIRDFSNKIAASKYKGKYLAFTERGLVNEGGKPVGIDYLVSLGITHVHLLPLCDYATVDEAQPDGQYNWGYDPENYNLPEGSYSTDPYHGEVRIRECKEMIKSLHEAGIGVIMDMVYNHTYDANSSLNKIVPYYYYRYTPTGANSSASGCGNDTASERYMFGKLMVDSASYWMREYKLDGLRFDLMGLHDLATMQEVERAVHTVNPNAVIYGEGWPMGATLDGSPQADQGNISAIVPTGNAIGGIAVFNDVIRDGLKGSVFYKRTQGYISGDTALTEPRVIFGIKGGDAPGFGWRVRDGMVINYMSAHDNHTLWDKLLLSNPDDDVATRIRMNRLGAAIIMLSHGTPFFQAGEEMLRSKGGDENSYISSDDVNNIDWSVLRAGSDEYAMMLYYKGLIAMRRGFDIFTDTGASVSAEKHGALLVITLDDGRGGKAMALINPDRAALPYKLAGEWYLVANGERAGTSPIALVSGVTMIDGISANIYLNEI